jgi:hypothetical protein
MRRMCPGNKDTVIVKLDGDKAQKQLVLCTLKVACTKLKETHLYIAVSFTKLYGLRRMWCVLAGTYSTHTTCVCTILQDMKLMKQVIDMCS